MASVFSDISFSWHLTNFTLILGGCLIFVLVKLWGNFHYFGDLLVKFDIFHDHKAKTKEIEDEKIAEIRSKYDLTINGCLPEFCLEKLPIYYKEWEDIVQRLPELNRKGRLKDEILDMKLLCCDNLKTVHMLRRAYILLGMLVHSYVNGENSIWDKVKEENEIEGGDVEVKEDYFDGRSPELTEELIAEGRSSVENKPAEKRVILVSDQSIVSTNDSNYVDACDRKEENGVEEEEVFITDSTLDSHGSIPYIPHQLAVPWFLICSKLDMPLVLTASLDLWNWKLKDKTKLHDLSNVVSLMSMTGTKSEMYFHMVPCTMHYVAAPLIPQIFILYNEIALAAQRSEFTDNEKLKITSNNVLLFIVKLTSVYKEFKNILKRLKDLVDLDTFYHVYRPFLNGFWPNGVFLELTHGDKKAENNPLIASFISGDQERVGTAEDSTEGDKFEECSTEKVGINMIDGGAVVEKVSAQSTAVCSVISAKIPNKGIIVNPKGPSAGQSTMIVLFDLLLGIKHKGSGKEFQDEMVNYMSPGHRKMIYDLRDLVKKHGTLRDFISWSEDQPQYQTLASAYNNCIESVVDFRSLHLGIAVKYLERTKKGTGASSFRDMLNSMTSSTKQMLFRA